MCAARARREASLARGSRLHGVDLVEQIASNTEIQRQRWIDLYYRLWERKAKVDIAETIVIVDGRPRDWFLASATTGEIQRKGDASQLTAIAIKKHFVRTIDTSALVRHIAVLVHEDAVGDMACAVLNELDFNVALGQATSPLWASSFLLQPFLGASRQHPQYPGTFVAKFNVSTTSSVRVLHTDQCFHCIKRSGHASSSSFGRPTSAPPTRSSTAKAKRSTIARPVEELVRTETAKLVAEIEAATQDTLRQLQAEFQITRTHRLVLVRVARVVFASDLVQAKGRRGNSPSRPRPSSAGSSAGGPQRCASTRFCQCKAFATGEINKTSTALATSTDLQQITRKSLQLCEEESAFLESFGAHSEAHLESHLPQRSHTSSSGSSSSAAPDAYEIFKRVLQRRMFMLRSTLWNPESDSFNAKPLAWEDEKCKQPQQYEMVRVCRACYLVYHAMDAERFQATKSTVKAAARRLSMIHNAKLLGAMMQVRPRSAPARRPLPHGAWVVNDGDPMERDDTDDHEEGRTATHASLNRRRGP